MTISTLFNEEVQIVDESKTIAYTVNPTWGENEWQVSGWVVTGGSDAACEHGAGEAMHAMGFRWWTPQKTTRPASLPVGGVNLARQQFVMPYMSMYLNYGFNDAARQTEFDRWAVLNNVADRRRPVGHAWSAIINWANAADGYYTANPGLLVNGGTSFNLTDGPSRAANLAKCVEWCRLNINEFQRCHFDPADGDAQSSELVFAFANDVVVELRATTHPQAMLGLYAYAGHRAPVAFPCPYLYVQVALGFNNLGIGYQALVQQWGAVAAEVALRGYGDIAAQDGWLPAYSGITRSNFFTSEYPGYIANGANGINMETSANWCKNVVSHWHGIRFWKTGQGTHSTALTEMLPALFNNDLAVSDLYELWGDPTAQLTDDLVYQSCQIIDTMQASPYREEFRRYMTFVMRERIIAKMGTARDGVYMTTLEQNLRWAWGMVADGTVHSYAYGRQQANSNVSDNGRADLNVNQSPHWRRYPVKSTLDDYERHRDELALLVERPSELSDETLVQVVVSPSGYAAITPTSAIDFTTQGLAVFVFVGPGTVTTVFDEAFRPTVIREFGDGMHTFSIGANGRTYWSGGILYLKAYPKIRLDPSVNTGQRWAYVPKFVRGKLRVSSGSRLTLIDSVSRKDITQNVAPFGVGAANPQTVVPGVVRVDNTNTRGFHTFGNLSPFISPSPTIQLMPRALAVREGLL